MSVYNKACGPQVGFCLFSFMGPVLGDNSPPMSSCLGRHNCHVFLNIFSSVCTIPVDDTGEPFPQQPLLPRAETTKLQRCQCIPCAGNSFCLPRNAALQCCLLSCIRNLLKHPCISELSDPFIHSMPRQFKCFYLT